MAYCVSCGVKLEPGTTRCPLCNTEVIAPASVVGRSSEDTRLFPVSQNSERDEHLLIDKRRRGLMELIVAFMVIAMITLAITGFALGTAHTFSPWFPIGCVFLGGWYFLFALVPHVTYKGLASCYVGLTILALMFIDLQNSGLSWSLYVVSSLVLYWAVGVMPWFFRPSRRLLAVVLAMILGAALFLVAIDALEGTGLLWAFPIGLPTLAVVAISTGALGLRLRFGQPTVTELVLSIILIASLGVVAGDFFSQRLLQSEFLLTWASQVWIVSICMGLFLFASATIRKVRLFFANKVQN